jgi:glycosyltransferase involved in cell wall biosynthesis
MPPSPLRIALLAPPMEPVPPPAYAGTERVVATLAEELTARGHEVTLFGSGDSAVSCELVPVVPKSLWATGYRGDVSAWIMLTIARAWEQHERFDLIHSHVETLGLPFARACPTPVLTTLHGRLDTGGTPALLDTFTDAPLVAISDSQRRWWPRANWLATIHHGLYLDRIPAGDGSGGHFALVGRATPEKGIAEAVELATRTGRPLRVAAKVHDVAEQEYFETLVRPAIDSGVMEFLGEVGPERRDALYGGAIATLMLGAWPEPFGLVAIESLAAGTPVIARRAGALPEIIEHGVDGFLVDDLTEAEYAVSRLPGLDRAAIRDRALRRFAAARMVDDYELVYRRVIARQTHHGLARAARRTAEGTELSVVS